MASDTHDRDHHRRRRADRLRPDVPHRRGRHARARPPGAAAAARDPAGHARRRGRRARAAGLRVPAAGRRRRDRRPARRLRRLRHRAPRRRAPARTGHGARRPPRGERRHLRPAGRGDQRARRRRRARRRGGQPRQHERAHRRGIRPRRARRPLHARSPASTTTAPSASSPRRSTRAPTTSRTSRSGATTRRRSSPMSRTRPSRGVPVIDALAERLGGTSGRDGLARRRLHPARRQARGRDHRGARLVVGRLGGERGDRACARRAARDGRRWTSAAVVSRGEYGVPEGLVCSFPVTSAARLRLPHRGGPRPRRPRPGAVRASVAELVAERDAVRDLGAAVAAMECARHRSSRSSSSRSRRPSRRSVEDRRAAAPALVGIAVSLLPFVPAIEVDPELILVGVLPPLLYSAAVSLPAIEFRRDFGPIAGLSVLLVMFSSVALAFFFIAADPRIWARLRARARRDPEPHRRRGHLDREASRRFAARRDDARGREPAQRRDRRWCSCADVAAVAVAITAASTPRGAAFLAGVRVGRARRGRGRRHRRLAEPAPARARPQPRRQHGARLRRAVHRLSADRGARRLGTRRGGRGRHRDRPGRRPVVHAGAAHVGRAELAHDRARARGRRVPADGPRAQGDRRAERRGPQRPRHRPRLAAAALAIIMVVRAAYVSLLVWLQSRRAPRPAAQRLESIQRAHRRDRAREPPDPDAAAAEARAARERPRAAGAARTAAVGHARAGHARPQRPRLLPGVAARLEARRDHRLGRHARRRDARRRPDPAPRRHRERPLLVFIAFLVAVGSLMLQGLHPAVGRAAAAARRHGRRRQLDKRAVRASTTSCARPRHPRLDRSGAAPPRRHRRSRDELVDASAPHGRPARRGHEPRHATRSSCGSR